MQVPSTSYCPWSVCYTPSICLLCSRLICFSLMLHWLIPSVLITKPSTPAVSHIEQLLQDWHNLPNTYRIRIYADGIVIDKSQTLASVYMEFRETDYFLYLGYVEEPQDVWCCKLFFALFSKLAIFLYCFLLVHWLNGLSVLCIAMYHTLQSIGTVCIANVLYLV